MQVQKLSKNEVLMVNIGSLSTGGRVLAVKADLAKIVLTQPVCTEIGEKIALSRRVEKHWRYVLKRLRYLRDLCPNQICCVTHGSLNYANIIWSAAGSSTGHQFLIVITRGMECDDPKETGGQL